MNQYRSLNHDYTIDTIEQLRDRIQERFPDSGLFGVSCELCEIAEDARRRCAWISRPHWPLRVGLMLFVLASLGIAAYGLQLIEVKDEAVGVGELIQAIEASMNEVVLIGAAIFFLITAEGRIKRFRALTALHELRAIAHVIDMHQLTKDPSLDEQRPAPTRSSPKRELHGAQLNRYLDYCSELLSLTAKTAALYAQELRDPVVLSTVTELETLTTGLSRKVWQKITLLHHHHSSD